MGGCRQFLPHQLTPDQMSLIRGRRYNRSKSAQGGDHKSKDQNDTLINTAETLAKEHDGKLPRDGMLLDIRSSL
jgi:hypothetical protein